MTYNLVCMRQIQYLIIMSYHLAFIYIYIYIIDNRSLNTYLTVNICKMVLCAIKFQFWKKMLAKGTINCTSNVQSKRQGPLSGSIYLLNQ